MNAKNSLSLIAALTLVASSAFAKSVAVDSAQSQVRWLGKKVTGQHNGTIGIKAGQLDIDGKNLKGGTVEIDMNSIANQDLTNAEYNAKLVGHLKSDDFFGVAKNPVSTFKITSVKPSKGGLHDVIGDLTIKGITHPITIPTKIDTVGGFHATGKAVIDRTKYEVRYGSGKFFQNLGDKMISDNFEIEMDIKTKN